MKEILLTALNNCANKYSKGFSRWAYLWQEKTTYEQQATELAKELESTGYVLLKRASICVDDDLTIFNDNNGE